MDEVTNKGMVRMTKTIYLVCQRYNYLIFYMHKMPLLFKRCILYNSKFSLMSKLSKQMPLLYGKLYKGILAYSFDGTKYMVEFDICIIIICTESHYFKYLASVYFKFPIFHDSSESDHWWVDKTEF